MYDNEVLQNVQYYLCYLGNQEPSINKWVSYPLYSLASGTKVKTMKKYNLPVICPVKNLFLVDS